MKIVDLSSEILLELNSDSSISLSSIASYLRSGGNLGKLNDLINTSFIIDSNSLEIIDSNNPTIEIGMLEAAVYAQLYYVYFYARKANSFLGAAAIDTVLEWQSDGGVIRTLNKNEIAKTYIQLKKDAKELLDKLVNLYRFHNYTPQQVIGTDTVFDNIPVLNYARRMILT